MARNEIMKSIEVRDLKAGQILAFTYAKVMCEPVCLSDGKRGMIDFIVLMPDGEVVQKSWNRHKLVNIIK